VRVVSDWFEQPNVHIVEPTERHWAALALLLTRSQVKGPLVTDAYLAALALEHGATLCSSDGDFSRFPGLRWHNPLES
jgi:predicted nucleic acid-binding protein